MNIPPEGAHSADPVREALRNLCDAADATNYPHHGPSWDRLWNCAVAGRTALAAPEGPAPTDPLDDAPVHASYKRMFEAAVVSLAEIDRLLGVEPDGCNDPETTVSALKDYIAGTTDAINARNEFVDAQYAAPEAPPPVEARQPLPPLPRPFVPGDEANPRDFYSAEQMQAYARAALADESRAALGALRTALAAPEGPAPTDPDMPQTEREAARYIDGWNDCVVAGEFQTVRQMTRDDYDFPKPESGPHCGARSEPSSRVDSSKRNCAAWSPTNRASAIPPLPCNDKEANDV